MDQVHCLLFVHFIIPVGDPQEVVLQNEPVLPSQDEGTLLTHYEAPDAEVTGSLDTSYRQSKDAQEKQDGHEFGVSDLSLVGYRVMRFLGQRLELDGYLRYV